MFSTTLNLKKDIYIEIKKIASELHISMSALIKEILDFSFTHLDIKTVRTDLTHYQKKQSKKNWKCFHIEFTETECNNNLFYRFKYRISLSKLLFVGFILFIDEIIEKIKKKSKNNNLFPYSYTSFIEIYSKLIENEVEIFIRKDKYT